MMDVNWLAVLTAGVINMIVGSVWYSPLMFEKAWRESLGITEQKMKERMKNMNMGKTYGTMFLGALVMGYVMSMFAKVTNTITLDMGALMGFWVWLGIVVPVTLGGVLFEEKSIKWFWISIGYYLVVLILVGALVASWR